ncbi:MAG TPA: hypothetical protein VGR30_20670 [Candidatus Binatia bacterium]|jgi:hypothetical protein|nr:hypothetical protein [Candidatus Binatia bacterium]
MRNGLTLAALIMLLLTACKRTDIVKDPDKAKLTWQWQPQGKEDRALEFRVKCGTASGRYDLPIVRVPFPKLEVPLKEVATKPGRYFCVVTAANQAGESTATDEVNFAIKEDQG